MKKAKFQGELDSKHDEGVQSTQSKLHYLKWNITKE